MHCCNSVVFLDSSEGVAVRFEASRHSQANEAKFTASDIICTGASSVLSAVGNGECRQLPSSKRGGDLILTSIAVDMRSRRKDQAGRGTKHTHNCSASGDRRRNGFTVASWPRILLIGNDNASSDGDEDECDGRCTKITGKGDSEGEDNRRRQ